MFIELTSTTLTSSDAPTTIKCSNSAAGAVCTAAAGVATAPPTRDGTDSGTSVRGDSSVVFVRALSFSAGNRDMFRSIEMSSVSSTDAVAAVSSVLLRPRSLPGAGSPPSPMSMLAAYSALSGSTVLRISDVPVFSGSRTKIDELRRGFMLLLMLILRPRTSPTMLSLRDRSLSLFTGSSVGEV